MPILCFWEKAKCSSQGAYDQVFNVPNYIIKKRNKHRTKVKLRIVTDDVNNLYKLFMFELTKLISLKCYINVNFIRNIDRFMLQPKWLLHKTAL